MPPPPADEPDFDALAATQKRGRRKAYAIVFGVFALLFALFAYAFIADEAPPDLSDLHVPRLNIPDEENAYAQLTKIALSLPPAAPEETDADHPFALMANGDITWDRDVMSADLTHYAPDLANRVAEALQLPASEAPEYTSYGDTAPEIPEMRRLSQIILRQARLAYENEDDNSALRYNLIVSQFGLRLTESRGTLTQFISGVAIQSIALNTIRKHADFLSPPADPLRVYLHKLTGHEISPEGLRIAYKLENRLFANAAAKLKPLNMSGFHKMPEAWLLHIPRLYQPNRTTRWNAEIIQSLIQQVDSPSSPATNSEAMRLLQRHTEATWLGRVENQAGRTFLALAVPISQRVNVIHLRAQADLRLTRLYLAMRLYHLDHAGKLPESLDELVPAYLPEIPLDPFDHLPLRYDPALTTIWSTGHKRLNVTEADGKLPQDMPAYRLRFVRPSEPLPTFEEYRARKNTPSDLFGNP